MAIYKIFPEKSATLYSYSPTLNTGIDEILEISTYAELDGTYQVARPIIKFSQSEITDVLANLVGGNEWDAYLKLSLANASQLPLNYSIYCHALAADWNMGTGRAADIPIITDGASWKYSTGLSGSVWFTNNVFPTGTTGYYSGSNIGGGLWYIPSNSVPFTNNSSKDIEIPNTDIVTDWYYNDKPNYGFILKYDDSLEFSTSSIELKYFSANTHTIYPPCLEIRWSDSVYDTGSLLPAIANSVVTIANNKSEYQQDSIQRIRINVRDKFPARSFQSTSVYLNNKALPTFSYWSIKDLDTEEIVVDYSTEYTRISCDSTGNYFDIYMNGLEPERYYKILIKTIIDGNTIVFDDSYYFKVIR
jgi:hypothetical protein